MTDIRIWLLSKILARRGVKTCVHYVRDPSAFFRSELSRFAYLHDSGKKTTIDIDLCQWRGEGEFEYIRFLEGKHEKEPMNARQLQLLKLISTLKTDKCEVEVYEVRGNAPFDSTTVTNLSTGKRRNMTQAELIRFLNFEMEEE